MKLILLIAACIIVIALALYALKLTNQIKKNDAEKQKKDDEERLLAQKNLDKRNNNIISDIKFIAQSLLSEQCETTEAVLRIHHLADAIDADIMKQQQFEAIHRHFDACKNMAIKEAYKELSKKQRFQQDQQRFRLEEENHDQILSEAKLLIHYAFDNLKNLH